MTKNYIVDDKELMKEWNWEKNNALGLFPQNLTLGSNKEAWWKCANCKYEWLSKISNRAMLRRGCPCCANKVVVVGKNDLATLRPDIARQWNFKRNGDLKPEQFSMGSGKKVWWVCKKGHEYQATILHRASCNGTNCPICNLGRQTSFAEQCLYFYVKKLYPDAINRYKADWLDKMELDVFIPSINYAIEYDGVAWHVKRDNLKREQKKYKLCHERNIKLIRVREEFSKPFTDVSDYQFGGNKYLYKQENLGVVIDQVLKFLNFSGIGNPINVDINKDKNTILSSMIEYPRISFATKFPLLAKEWDKELNGELTPEMFSPYSDHKGWWCCPICKHKYESSFGHRAYGTACPKCGIEKSKLKKCKKVVMIDLKTNATIKVFSSIADAGRELNVNISNITMVCKRQRNSAGGFGWKYLEEQK